MRLPVAIGGYGISAILLVAAVYNVSMGRILRNQSLTLDAWYWLGAGLAALVITPLLIALLAEK